MAPRPQRAAFLVAAEPGWTSRTASLPVRWEANAVKIEKNLCVTGEGDGLGVMVSEPRRSMIADAMDAHAVLVDHRASD